MGMFFMFANLPDRIRQVFGIGVSEAMSIL